MPILVAVAVFNRTPGPAVHQVRRGLGGMGDIVRVNETDEGGCHQFGAGIAQGLFPRRIEIGEVAPLVRQREQIGIDFK